MTCNGVGTRKFIGRGPEAGRAAARVAARGEDLVNALRVGKGLIKGGGSRYNGVTVTAADLAD